MKATPENNYLYNPVLRRNAYTLRNSMTKSECLLWKEYLSKKRLGCMFRRQRPIGNYIVDFVCLNLLLVIEVDGESHEREETLKRDKSKQLFLEDAGFYVLRLSSEEVFHGGDGLTDILRATVEKLNKQGIG